MKGSQARDIDLNMILVVRFGASGHSWQTMQEHSETTIHGSALMQEHSMVLKVESALSMREHSELP